MVKRLGLEFSSWLEVLPCYDENGAAISLADPVPIVLFKRTRYEDLVKQGKREGFKLEWDTCFSNPMLDREGIISKALVHVPTNP